LLEISVDRTNSHRHDLLGLTWCFFIILFGATYGAGSLSHYDLFWHLALGRITIDTRSLQATDPLTFTAGQNLMVHHEWLSQVLLAAAERLGGLAGLRILCGIAIAALLWILLISFLRATGSCPFVAGTFLALSWIMLEPNVGLRLMCLDGLAAIVFALWWPRYCGKLKFSDLAFLGAITFLRVNLHSSVLLVPIVAGLVAIESILFRLRQEAVLGLLEPSCLRF
jgi:hypothetical protein